MARLIVLFLLLATPLRAQEALSGRYGELVLVVRADGALEGAFVSARGEPGPNGIPPFTCAFLLSGRLSGGVAAVLASHPADPEVIAGELRVTPGGASLRFVEDPPGCANTVGTMSREPYALPRDGGANGWTGARLVTRRTALRGGPGHDRPYRGTLLGFEAVALLREEGAWAFVEIPGEGVGQRGWLPRSVLSPPPR